GRAVVGAVLGDEIDLVDLADLDLDLTLLGTERPADAVGDVAVEAHGDGAAELLAGRRIGAYRRAAIARHPAEHVVERNGGEGRAQHGEHEHAARDSRHAVRATPSLLLAHPILTKAGW